MKSLSNYIIDNQINEMSRSLSDYTSKIWNYTPQLIQNWCLVKLCDLYPNEWFSKTRNHWSSELKTIMYNINSLNIKKKKKYNLIYNEIVYNSELNDKSEVSSLIRRKFHKEGLEKYVNIISEECTNSINDICKVLADDNINTIDDYIDGEIG